MKSNPSLLAVSSNPENSEVKEIGKYWAFRCGSWYKVQSLPCKAGGTGSMVYAPIDRRGRSWSVAIMDCNALFGPLKFWRNVPPKINKESLLKKGVSDFWLKNYTIKTLF